MIKDEKEYNEKSKRMHYLHSLKPNKIVDDEIICILNEIREYLNSCSNSFIFKENEIKGEITIVNELYEEIEEKIKLFCRSKEINNIERSWMESTIILLKSLRDIKYRVDKVYKIK